MGALKKEGESGRKKLNQYTRYGTVVLTIIQGYFIAVGLESRARLQASRRLLSWEFSFGLPPSQRFVGGTMFLMWLGEQITSRGIGNGISLIVMAGIVSQLPRALVNVFEGGRTGTMSPLLIFGILILVVGLIAFICFMERAQRRVLIQYPKRATARGMMQSDKSFLPLKINTANVIPPIFASSLLLMPLTLVQFAGNRVAGESTWGDIVLAITTNLQHGSPLFMALYAAGIIFFCFFYTAVVFNPEETADNLKRYGGLFRGIRPEEHQIYLDYVLTAHYRRAAHPTFICLVPEYLVTALGIPFSISARAF